MKKVLLSLLMSLVAIIAAHAQDVQISGTVLSSTDNLPMIGVAVAEVEGTGGTTTDLDGKFTLNVSAGVKVEFSYIGYKTQEIVIGTQTEFTIIMQEDIADLDEVVVVGYGVQKKSVVTAAISRVTAEDLNATKPSRVEDALKGKVSGVQITQSSGQPGADSKVRIRGIGTVNNSDPLYIVDGMPVDGGINYLNPTDISSVEILKDAASAAIYGARAANGVVLVTTKSGKSGKATINYDFSYGIQNPWTKKEVLNATEYMTIMNEMDINDGNLPRYSADQVASAGVGTDWQDLTFNYDAPVQQHQVSVSGGSDKSQYFLSFGYYNQEGIIGGDYDKSNYERYSVRSNSTYTVFEDESRNFLNKVKVGANIGYSRSISTGITANSEYGSILGSAVGFSPLLSPYADDSTLISREVGGQMVEKTEAGWILHDYPTAIVDAEGRVLSLPPAGYQEITNPLAQLNDPSSWVNSDDKFVGTFYAEADLLPGLKFKSSYGMDLAFWGYHAIGYEYYMGSMKQLQKSYVQDEMNRGYKWQIENVLTYNNTFDDVHNLTVVAGQSAQRYSARNLGGSDYDLLTTDPTMGNINSAIGDSDDERVWGGTGGYDFVSLASYFARADYNYDERYMIQFTMRYDGSSRFGLGNKWAMFPAVSAGWNILNEPYMEDVTPSWMDVFKLRFSWGRNGNENIGNFRYASLMSGGQNYYFGGGYNVADESNTGTLSYGSSPAALANSNIMWEESEQTDIGFESRMFGSRLTVGFDYYVKKTNGMLMDVQIPSYVGQAAPLGNLGSMKNSGIEIEATWKHSINDFNYFVSANASYVKNKLIDLGNASGNATYVSAGASGIGDYVRAENGEVWPYFYGMKTDGLFQNWDQVNSYVNNSGELLQPEAQPGDVIFVDYNGDGVINDNDRTKIGKGMPDWSYGFTLGADWKGFDVNLFFQGTIGNDIYDFSQRGDIPAMNRPAWILERWHGEGTSNTIPRMTAVNANKNWRSSDLYIKDGSYLRLKSAQIGYTLPEAITKRVSIQRLRVYVAAENLLTFTEYDGFDPEIAADGYTNIGVDRGIYPQARTISVGANISF